MPYVAKYGVEYKFTIPVPKKDDTDFAATGDWAPVVGDVKVSKNGGTVVDVAADPPAVAVGGTGSVLFQFTVSATEMQAKEIVLQIIDAAVENQAVVIQTYGHGSAEIIGDWNTVGDWKGNTATPLDAAGIRTAVGLGAANLDTQIGNIPTTAMRGTDGSNQVTPLDAAGIRTAVGLASGNLDTQLNAIPTTAMRGTDGASTHDAAAVKTAMEINGSKLDELWEMTEDSGGTHRLTTEALAQAPSGGGLSASETRTALGMASANLDAQLTAIPTTAMRGTDGANITTPPTTAQIKTAMEADGTKLDHLWEMTEDDSGTRRLTENALEEAPSGTGGDASAANQELILAQLGGIGETEINHDTGGTGNLKLVDPSNVGVGDAVVRAFLTSEYSGDPSTLTIRGATMTNDDGEWVGALSLNVSTSYTILFEKAGFLSVIKVITTPSS